MQSPPTWLTKLKAVDLHKLAVLIGTPCSGTKSAQVHGIQNALALLPRTVNHGTSAEPHRTDKISLVSIDMGIRNLAYSHWTTTLVRSRSDNLAQYSQPILKAWRKIDVSSSSIAVATSNGIESSVDPPAKGGKVKKAVLTKESFEPIDYANHAYNFIRSVVDEHQPTHVLIERQRFRSGGNSAVQEWTIRVGVFEGMLYAVLKSLAAESRQSEKLTVEPMLPTRVNRYWLEGDLKSSSRSTARKTAREVKQLKIELVTSLLQAANTKSSDKLFTCNDEIANIISAFIDRHAKSSKRRISLRAPGDGHDDALDGISKLDDLADCLLQGLAWLQWQNNRLTLEKHKEDAYRLMTRALP